MTQSSQNNKTLAPLTNVYALATLTERLLDRAQGLPGMGCFYGFSGFGKSMASTFTAIEFDACVVEMGDSWSKGTLCEAMCAELGLKPERTIAKMVKQICASLAERNVPLIVDEADYLLKNSMVETVREIHDKSYSPVILIGEELLPQKLRKYERVHGRILRHVAAEPCSDADFDLLRELRCPDIEITTDLLDKIKTVSRGSARRIVENLSFVQELGATKGLQTVSLKDWGTSYFFEGSAPMPRRIPT